MNTAITIVDMAKQDAFLFKTNIPRRCVSLTCIGNRQSRTTFIEKLGRIA